MDGGVLAGRFLDPGLVFGLVLEREAADETSAVHVSGQHPCRESGKRGVSNHAHASCAHEQEWDLVNVKRDDQPRSDLNET